MKKSFHVLLTSLLLVSTAVCSYAENLSEGPWYNLYVNGINRLPARATSYSYQSADDALACDRDASRIESLNGTWKFMFAADTKEAPLEFWQANLGSILIFYLSIVLGNFVGCNFYRWVIGSNPE